MPVTTSGWVTLHTSGISPGARPACCSMVPMAPSRIQTRLSSNNLLGTGFALLSFCAGLPQCAGGAACQLSLYRVIRRAAQGGDAFARGEHTAGGGADPRLT